MTKVTSLAEAIAATFKVRVDAYGRPTVRCPVTGAEIPPLLALGVFRFGPDVELTSVEKFYGVACHAIDRELV